MPRLKRQLMKTMTRKPPVNPCKFCSELIVDVFLGLRNATIINESVLRIDKPSNTISPNDLTDSRISRLVKMEGVVELPRRRASNDESNLGALSDAASNLFVESENKMREFLRANASNMRRWKPKS